jgi:hypothetical protein
VDDWIASTLAQVHHAEHRARVARCNAEGWKQPVRQGRRGRRAAREALAAALVALAARLAPTVGDTVGATPMANGVQR